MVKISEKHSKSANSIETDIIETKFAKDLNLENFGWISGFYRSSRKKITVTGLFSGFCKMQDEKENTLSKWALHTGMSVGQTVSKQGLSNRLNGVGIELVKLILQHALSLKLHEYFEQEKIQNKRLFAKFNHILIQDSTMQKLPPELSEIFKSSYSHGKQAATLRLQAIYNFTTETWVDFELGGFTDNDQSKAMMITKVAQPKDLILRDLGYFTLESLEHLIENQFVITSWDKKTHLFDVENQNQIHLLQLFKGKRKIDQPVLVGSKKKLPMRLVAKKLPTEMAKDRIKKAKEDRNSKANHSKTYYELLKWEIYLTNVDAQTLSINDVAKLYGLRWYIEILFKSWKSYASFKTILEKERMTYCRTVMSIYLMLIRFVYFMLDIYHYVRQKVTKVTDRLISILKFLNVCRSLADKIMNIRILRELDPLINHFARHATYEKRRNRLNMQEKYLYFNEL